MNIELILKDEIKKAVKELYNQEIQDGVIQLQDTRKEFQGDITLVVFPIVKISKKSPEATATEIGNFLQTQLQEVEKFNIVKGFLNLTISTKFWLSYFQFAYSIPNFGTIQQTENSKTVVVEYSSPNTNKPLHLGHIRNNVLGYSISEIFKANGYKVIKTNIVNDRGIHICKSMLAWLKWGEGEKPETTGIKGDHLVGKYYVLFDKEYKKQIEELKAGGLKEEEAKKKASIIEEAQDMLRKWEAGDEATISLWKTMNTWVLTGFDETYKKLGVDFDIIYYESNTYKLGKSEIYDGLKKGVLIQKDDQSVWIDLQPDGLDEKVLLRSDGTSVYMTQDIGTALQRYQHYNFDKQVYVVGNEQEYHFKVLFLILQKLGYEWAKDLYHLSYGMVELPHGKMKSREGTVVDADDLIEEMIDTARETSQELGKLDGYSEEEAEQIYRIIALGALKYFIIKVDPRKNMLFNPKESIDFNGNTGPFIQYTYARIQSVLRKAPEQGLVLPENVPLNVSMREKEIELIKFINKFPAIINEACLNYSPAVIANFLYDFTKEFNQFYHEFPILKEPNPDERKFRLCISAKTGEIIKTGMKLLGIDVPERM